MYPTVPCNFLSKKPLVASLDKPKKEGKIHLVWQKRGSRWEAPMVI